MAQLKDTLFKMWVKKTPKEGTSLIYLSLDNWIMRDSRLKTEVNNILYRLHKNHPSLIGMERGNGSILFYYSSGSLDDQALVNLFN